MDRSTHLVRMALRRACLLAGATGLLFPLGISSGVPVEPPIVPTVNMPITPNSAIALPVEIFAGSAAVWTTGGEQRMLLAAPAGRVRIDIGYRTLRADEAAVFLTPRRESGESTFDLAIYLKGHVAVEEGPSKTSTVANASELLVTSRISGAVQLSGTTPRAVVEDKSPTVVRGDELRQQLLTLPPPLMHIPVLTTTDTERALQAGWIARGPGNKLIAGPGEAMAAKAAGLTTTAAGTAPAPAVPPRPSLFATADKIESKVIEGDQVTVGRGSFFLMYQTPDKNPPIIIRAQRAVLFGPPEKKGATQPAETEAGSKRPVTTAYMEGDVTIEYGDYTVKADRILYDFTTHRAIMLDAILSTVVPERNLPAYIRADEMRQLARGEYFAKSAKLSISEFYTPHYHIGASDTYLRDITPRDEEGKATGPAVFEFKAENATLDVRNTPIFWWPYLSGDTSKNNIPLTKINAGYSSRYGMTLQTQWDVFGLLGMTPPENAKARLNLDYWGKRGPGGGIDASQKTDDSESLLRSYVLQDHGHDDLGRDRDNIDVPETVRGRILGRHRQQLDDKWSMQIEGSYISDPNFLEQYFPSEFDSDKEEETSIYVKRQGDTDALTFLGKWSLYDFVSTADQYADQFTTEKAPEVKYWRIGDSLLDVFTYYSESGGANVRSMLSDQTPARLGLNALYPALPATETFRQMYKAMGWTSDYVLRGDSRHELDMPLQFGDVKVVPYVTGRITAWDDEFPETADGGSTVRAWGSAGVRGATQFWKVYDDVENQFLDLHRMRHVIEPGFNIYAAGANKGPEDLQPFDRDVESISRASAAELSLNQKFQTKRGGPGHWRNVDWLVINTSLVGFFDKADPNSDPNGFLRGQPLRGAWFMSRPELSQVNDAFNWDVTWRVGERVRYLMDGNVNFEKGRVETFSNGIAIDQSPVLSYFIGNRYVAQPDPTTTGSSDEWTVAFDYQLTRKYELIMAESYDFGISQNILTSGTIVRKLPRFNAALTISYDANRGDTSVVVTMWPEGFPNLGFGSSTLRKAAGP